MSDRDAEQQNGWTLDDWEKRLRGSCDTVFSPAEVSRLPEPVRRYLTAAIAEGTPLTTGVRLKMRGHIKLG